MKYLFGPVNSRRLGLSMGIDIVPAKICNYNCIYCEVGATTTLTCDRGEYAPLDDILAEITFFLANMQQSRPPDVFTITGSGEPTLHSGLGRIIRFLKDKTDIPVGVLTNGMLLYRADVRRELQAADIVIPSLDAAQPLSFRKINRPAGCVDIATVIDGLHLFAKEYKGHFWLEILLVRGINDTEADIDALAATAARIRPERVQLNTVARPPLERFARPVEGERLEQIAGRLSAVFDGPVDIVADFVKKKEDNGRAATEDEIVQMLRRRPCSGDDISEALGLPRDAVDPLLDRLEAGGRVLAIEYNGRKYYQMGSHPHNFSTAAGKNRSS
jgi:wyosine [tRNA(Phe)-imidazoG37] synthetase (radical SAM superfamily)